MKEYWIETSPIRFCEIYHMKIDAGINRHGTARIEGYIADEWEEDYAKQLGERAWVFIHAVDRKGNRETIFCGLTAAFMFTEKEGQKVLALELKSGTHLLDIEKHTRFFQDTSLTFAEICRQLGAAGGGQCAVKAGEADNAIGRLMVQHEETDWQFLVRLLGSCGSYIIPNIRWKGIFYTVGMPQGREREKGRYSLEKDLYGYRKKRAEGMKNISEADCMVCCMERREICFLGDIFQVLGLPMCVWELKIRYVKGELICHCRAGTVRSIRTHRVLPETLAGISFEATVKEVRGDKVQLLIQGDEHEGKCGKLWFPFSTPYSAADGTGWYCMPEQDDRVRLRFPDGEESNAYVVSAVHLPAGNGERKNPAHKIWKNRQQKEIRFTPDSILITNNLGMKIEMVDGKGIQIESDKSIMIKAGGNINLVSDGAGLMLAADTSLVMHQGGTSIQLEDGIRFMGGEFHVQ